MTALALWHEIIRTRNPDALHLLLADDVVFHSPVVHRPQVGKHITTQYLKAALQVFLNETFTYVREVAGDQDAVLEFTVTIDGIVVNGVDMMRWNADGQIVDFKVMIRPAKALTLIHERMAAALQASPVPQHGAID